MARRRALIRREVAHDYTVEILGRRYPVTDMVRAAQIVESVRDQNGYGASEMGSQFPIRDAGVTIGYVSYNGRVWAGRPEDYGTAKVHLVYDPSEKAHRDAYAVPRSATPVRVVRNNPHGDPYRPCGVHEDSDECEASPSSCRWGGCDAYGHSFDEPSCKTKPRYYADTKSFFCDAGRKKFLEDFHWDDDKGWIDKDGEQG